MEKSKAELLREIMPDTAKVFENLISVTFRDGALSLKIKELIAIGVAVSMGCNDCMDHHIIIAKEQGATREEITEAMSVGFEMGIGRLYPAMVRSISKNFGIVLEQEYSGLHNYEQE